MAEEESTAGYCGSLSQALSTPLRNTATVSVGIHGEADQMKLHCTDASHPCSHGHGPTC